LEAKQSSKTIIMETHTTEVFDDVEVPDFGLPCYVWRWTLSLGYSYTIPLSFMEVLGLKYQHEILDTTAHSIGFAVKYIESVK
jgi:hypothetical protein